MLFVRRGSCAGVEVACDYDAAQWPTLSVSLSVTGGEQYFIYSAHNYYTGSIVLTYHLTVTPP